MDYNGNYSNSTDGNFAHPHVSLPPSLRAKKNKFSTSAVYSRVDGSQGYLG